METELKERIVIDGADGAVAKLGMVAVAAGRLASQISAMKGPLATVAGNIAHSFHGVTEIAHSMLGIAGVWKIAETIVETDHLYQAVQRVRDMTELSASAAHTMFDMFELSGIGMESAERIMTSMTRSGQKMAQAIAVAGTQGQTLSSIMKRLGVSVKAGPEDRLFALSKAAEASKLRITDLVTAFNIPRSQAAQMMTMLKQGPEKLKAIQADTLKSSDLIDEAALESHRLMLQARRELADAWGGLVGTFYKSLIPAVTAILNTIKGVFDDIAPIAAAIGDKLSKHMTLVVGLAKTYLALLLAAKVANMFSGESMGVFGRGKQLIGMASGGMAKRAASAGAMDFFAAKAASPGIGMFSSVGGPLIRVIGSVAGRLGIIGAVIAVLIVAFEMLKRNVFGLKDAFGGSLSRLFDTLKSIAGRVVAVLGALWGAIQPVLKVLAGGLLFGLLGVSYVLEGLAKVIDGVMWALTMFINGVIWLLNKIPGVNIDLLDLDAKQSVDDGKRGTGDTKPADVNQDFRGSKFEITNNFPPGIDGGRVAVAFGDELARLGERRLDSGVRPLFSYR